LANGVTATIVDGTTPQDERDDNFSQFEAADCQMLLGVDVVREGLDLPIAQCLIDLQPTHQFRVYWQKLGRVKRPHPGQESAVVIDMAGNYWRHLVHPDMDPPWGEITNGQTIEEINEKKAGVRCPECGSKELYSIEGGRYKCEDCGHEWTTSKPWVCPHCKQALATWQKVIGGVCPNCGERVGVKPIRHIRMADGTLRAVSVDETIKRKKGKANAEQATWDKWRYIANGWNKKNSHLPDDKLKKLEWCGAMYQRDMGAWPKGLKNCPDEAGDWKRTPAAVYPWMNNRT
jgi:DNA-directed RNA polymerase subunit RPC12/RpoP